MEVEDAILADLVHFPASACFSTTLPTYRMTLIYLALFFGTFDVISSAGSYGPKKVQIHVPHNIQHHHHTHTKYHFITVPVLRTANETTTTTVRPAVMIPVMPLMPGLVANMTPVAAAATTAPPTVPTALPVAPQMIINDFDLIDMLTRRRGEKYVPPPPMRFRTVINVQETKKIPLSELLNLGNLLQKEPPRRVKVEIVPDRFSKPPSDWPSYRDTDHDPDSASYQSRMEQVVEKPEWTAVKQLLEKHIREDFPGLNIQTELKQLAPSERSDVRPAQMDLKHIGYILIDDKDQKHFVGFDEPVTDPAA